ncbi:hypothetical protein OUZ56_028421 [Daphnia magna]|uniref:Uncharacterized protein n=1 Tax=Daphnia magna TaxID=35525 RepID=A0ABR0B4D7_9CRUS|nr:hypothetical protein OUZ56_028421 [Daphnia magna]
MFTLVVEKQQKILCCLEFHRDSQAGTERNGNTRSASRPLTFVTTCWMNESDLAACHFVVTTFYF